VFPTGGPLGPTLADEIHMETALALAERGRGRVRPNPVVGAVVVKDGSIVGRGFHRRIGGAHAEVEALRDAGRKARGATLVVSLEPCAHHGRTGPCVEAIVEAGIARVVAAIGDPCPKVRGRGFRALRRAGIGVVTGVLEERARAVNAGYLSVHERGRPRIALKLATSLDGRIAPATGGSRWLTGVESRRAAHHLRARHDTIVVGANTLRADDPELTVRDAKLPRGVEQPLRVVVSSDLDLPLRAKVFAPALAAGTVVATVDPELVPKARRGAFERRASLLARRGAQIWFLPRDKRAAFGGVSLPVLASRLASEFRHDVLVEGGAALGAAFADQALVDELWLFVAPLLLGGAAPAWRFGEKATSLADAWRLESPVVVQLGDDRVIHGKPVRPARSARGTGRG